MEAIRIPLDFWNYSIPFHLTLAAWTLEEIWPWKGKQQRDTQQLGREVSNLLPSSHTGEPQERAEIDKSGGFRQSQKGIVFEIVFKQAILAGAMTGLCYNSSEILPFQECSKDIG